MMQLQRFLGAAWRYGIIGGVVLLALAGAAALAAEDRPPRVEVELTESFYRALRAEGAKTYSTDKSEEYLRQIAVSARYAVESNLKIIKQQERIIALLEKLNRSKK
ncbi:MAG: hypothetical protein P8X96_06990 [Desulfobacteraceae bacterium]|jgi:hypothetical protein